MKLLIEIAENNYKEMCEHGIERMDFDIQRMMKNATSIPDTATTGDVIKALYPNRTFFNEDSCCVTMKEYGKTEEDAEYLTYIDFDGDWWNAPYKGGE